MGILLYLWVTFMSFLHTITSATALSNDGVKDGNHLINTPSGAGCCRTSSFFFLQDIGLVDEDLEE